MNAAAQHFRPEWLRPLNRQAMRKVTTGWRREWKADGIVNNRMALYIEVIIKPIYNARYLPTLLYVAFLGVGVGDPGIERRSITESALLAVAIECILPMSSAAGPRPKTEPTCCLAAETLLERRERVDHARKDWAGAREGVRRVFPLVLW